MKKFILLGIFISIASFSQAQETGTIRLQVGGDYGFKIETFGVNFGGEYFITENISAAPNYTIYFPEGLNASSLNVDARYYLTLDELQWYGMVGYTNYSVSNKIMGVKYSDNWSGVNIGSGGVLRIADNLALNPEIKYQTIGDGQFVVKLGIVYLL
tara:strand:- start:2257 stop:2724 length:468 start_codon:yes stop_codon:yes gene_type:complete